MFYLPKRSVFAGIRTVLVGIMLCGNAAKADSFPDCGEPLVSMMRMMPEIKRNWKVDRALMPDLESAARMEEHFEDRIAKATTEDERERLLLQKDRIVRMQLEGEEVPMQIRVEIEGWDDFSIRQRFLKGGEGVYSKQGGGALTISWGSSDEQKPDQDHQLLSELGRGAPVYMLPWLLRESDQFEKKLEEDRILIVAKSKSKPYDLLEIELSRETPPRLLRIQRFSNLVGVVSPEKAEELRRAGMKDLKILELDVVPSYGSEVNEIYTLPEQVIVEQYRGGILSQREIWVVQEDD